MLSSEDITSRRWFDSGEEKETEAEAVDKEGVSAISSVATLNCTCLCSRARLSTEPLRASTEPTSLSVAEEEEEEEES